MNIVVLFSYSVSYYGARCFSEKKLYFSIFPKISTAARDTQHDRKHLTYSYHFTTPSAGK